MIGAGYLLIAFGLVLTSTRPTHALELVAYLSQHGLHGEISFTANLSASAPPPIHIRTALQTTLQFPEQLWSWSLHQRPVDYTDMNGARRCSAERLGAQLLSLDERLGQLQLPGNESAAWQRTDLALSGRLGLWGKSLLLQSTDDPAVRVCATITTRSVPGVSVDHVAEARFHAGIAGSMWFRWLAAADGDARDTIIHTDLWHIGAEATAAHAPFTNHSWKLYVTDIFDTDAERAEANCNVLQLVFDQQNRGAGRAIGDIDARLGSLQVATRHERQRAPQLFHDPTLELLPSDLSGPQRQLYVVVFDNRHPDVFAACARIRHIQPRAVRAHMQGSGWRAEVRLRQRQRFEPLWVNVTVASARAELRPDAEVARDMGALRVHQLPARPDVAARGVQEHCATAGDVFNPTRVLVDKVPPPGYGTQDQYAVGDLTGKLLQRSAGYAHRFYGGAHELNGIYWDVFGALSGAQSLVHRAVSVRNGTTAVAACGSLELYDARSGRPTAMAAAQVLYRYPIVGRVLLRQPRDEPWSDATVLFEYLIHADGATVNNTGGHRWAVHAEPPGADFYNWSRRCESARDVFNPWKVRFDAEPATEEEDNEADADGDGGGGSAERVCSRRTAQLCRLGDLSGRWGRLAIAGRKAERARSRRMFVDQQLALSGHHNVLGKALVVYDDGGPEARGERLACSIIGGYHWRKAVARDWHANGGPLTLTGRLEMTQQSEYDLTNVEVGFKGLVENSGYHVHITPVEGNLEFPCEATTLYGHWNPRAVNPRHSPAPARGSTDQYELGDLSGKFGTLDGYRDFTAAYNDSNLPLFGYETLLGRSIVVHKREKQLRWACSTLERGYAPTEAREIRAIASFHHPLGFAHGFVRMTQLIHADGSASDTIVEVRLRHPGVNDRNVTRGHRWQVWVNPVGVDATVAQTATRCVAGGYIWNPFYTQLADPLNVELYAEECGPDNPLRCYVGDASARVGTVDLGVQRVVFADPNMPLEGRHNAMGRSLVVFGPDGGGERYACANIEPDHDIVKYINLQKPPKFVVAQFLEDVRHVMGLPEWMLRIDSRRTRTLHGGACIQMQVHFQGPQAHRIERDLTLLIATGRMAEPSIAIPGWVDQKRKQTLSYRACGVRDPNEKDSKTKGNRLFGGGSGAASVAASRWTALLAIAAVVIVNAPWS